jgi:hypothetical protein
LHFSLFTALCFTVWFIPRYQLLWICKCTVSDLWIRVFRGVILRFLLGLYYEFFFFWFQNLIFVFLFVFVVFWGDFGDGFWIVAWILVKFEILGFGDVLNLNFFFQFWGVYFWIILVVSEIHLKKKIWKFEIWGVFFLFFDWKLWYMVMALGGFFLSILFWSVSLIALRILLWFLCFYLLKLIFFFHICILLLLILW